MKNNKVKFKIHVLSIFLALLLVFPCFSISSTNNAYAEENIPSIQKVIDESIFIAFKKLENGKQGRTLTACFLVPTGYYLPDTYSYGVFIVPQRYIERYIKRGDYINELKEQGKAYIEIPATKTVDFAKGTGINCGIAGILDANVNLEFVFALFCKDKDGNYAYSYLERQTYSTSTATAITYEEEEEIAEQRLLDARLEKIARKTETLSNSLYIYFILGASAVVIIWGAYIGIRIIVAKRKEEKIDSRGMLTRFLIGIVIVFVLALGCPLLINGLSSWVG